MKTQVFTKITVLIFLPIVAVQADSIPSWKLGATIITLKNGTLTIRGSGAMEDMPPRVKVPTTAFDSLMMMPDKPKQNTFTVGRKMANEDTRALWNNIKNNIAGLVIEEGVTHIGDYTFLNCKSLRFITIPNGMVSIGDGAFAGCTSLTLVTIPNSVKTVGEAAFSGCTNLTSISISNSVIAIEGNTFLDCYSLTSVTIGNSVMSIGEFAFAYCTSLTSITIPKSVKTIGEDPFYRCGSLTSIIVKNPVPPQVESMAEFRKKGRGYTIVEDWASEEVWRKYYTIEKIVSADMAADCLYVPLFSIPAYRLADGWKRFKHIRPIEPTKTVAAWLAAAILSVSLLSAAAAVVIKKSR